MSRLEDFKVYYEFDKDLRQAKKSHLKRFRII